jgi:hypothetical protein
MQGAAKRAAAIEEVPSEGCLSSARRRSLPVSGVPVAKDSLIRGERRLRISERAKLGAVYSRVLAKGGSSHAIKAGLGIRF